MYSFFSLDVAYNKMSRNNETVYYLHNIFNIDLISITQQEDFIICATKIYWTKQKQQGKQNQLYVDQNKKHTDVNHGLRTPNIIVKWKPQKMSYLGEKEEKTKRDRIRNQIIKMGLQIMPFKEITE